MSLSDDLGRFIIRATEEAEETRKAICMELFASVILDTPVDTGRARGNWQTSIGSPASGAVDRIDADGGAAIAEAQTNLGQTGDTIYLSNNLPYIGKLEFDGWSDQAPAGMVRKNMARIHQIMTEQARRNRR